MLKPDQNELLTRVGAGTPMGEFFRQFWFPLIPTSDMPGAGERPLRLKLLGESLVAFRDTDGVVGLLSEYCPHRGAPLSYGRNEEGGLRCVYHGWKFSVDGRCIDMPNEPTGATFKNKIRQTSYPCREVNGVVWAYMGPRSVPPPLPEYGLATMPISHKYIQLSVRECNWAQAMEGDLDLSHGAYLHSTLRKEFLGQNHLDRFTGERPHLEALDTPYGEMHAVRRSYDEEHFHWGVGHFLFPFFTVFPTIGDSRTSALGHAWVPIDDTTTLVWFYAWDPNVPINGTKEFKSNPMFEPEWEQYREPTPEPMSRWRLRAAPENDFGYNEEAQRSIRFSGLPTVDLQDHALQVGMGPVANRSIEHLGTTDLPQIRVRRRLLKAAQALRDEGLVPDCLETPEVYRIRAASGLLPREESWVEGTRDWIKDEFGVPIHAKGHVAVENLATLEVD